MYKMTIINTKNREDDDFIYPEHMIAAFLSKESISFWDTKSNSYNRVRLKESSKEKINAAFLKLLSEIDDNLHLSYVSERYSHAFDDLVHRNISARIVETKTEFTTKERIERRLIIDEHDIYDKQVDIELSVKPVSKELFTSLIKLNEKLTKTRYKELRPIQNTDQAFINEFSSEMSNFPNKTLEGWAEWLNNKNKKTEDKSVSSQEKNDGMER